MTAQIIIGKNQSSKRTGHRQAMTTAPTIADVEPSHRELYLVPPYFFIINCRYFANDVTPQYLWNY